MSQETSLTPSDTFTHQEHDLDTIRLKSQGIKTFDVGLALLIDDREDKPLSPGDLRRIRRKVDAHLLPLLCSIYTMQWIDKNTLSASSILGILDDAHLTTNQFNTAASAFFVGYLVFQWPQNLALQRFPVGKWMSFNLVLWSLFLGLHAVCHNFAGLFILRFFLGACEGCTNAGLVLVCSMFYTRREISERIAWTYLCNGVAQILSSFLQFGIAHVSTEHGLAQWQWFMVTVASVTFVIAILFLLFFPDNPTNAWFLTVEERVIAVRRVRENQNGIETKIFKTYQFVEAVTDPKCWLLFLFMVFALLEGGIATQYSIIIKSFGFTELQTTLLGIPGGFSQIFGILIACCALRFFPNSRGWISMASWTTPIVCCFIQLLLPFQNKTGHLIGIYLMYLGVQPAVIIGMSWAVSNTAGHTKKTTATAMTFLGWSLGNALGSQFWLDKYKPSNRVPWAIVITTCSISALLALLMRTLFARENKRRDGLKADALRMGKGTGAFEESMLVETVDVDGKVHKRRVDKMYLDLTDGENLAFRYVL